MPAPGSSSQLQRPPPWAQALDLVALALLILAAFLLIHGGVVLHVGSVRVSLTSVWRPFAWAAAVILVRHLLVARPAIHQWTAVSLLEAGRAPGRLADDAVRFADGVEPATAGQARSKRTTIAAALAVVLLYAVLTAVMTYPQIRDMYRVSPDTADPLLSTWRLAWFAHQLPRDPLHLYDANIFYPERRTLAYSDAMLVPSLMIAPLVWLGTPQVIAHNVLLLAGFALSGAAMFLLVRSLTRHTGAALFAGFVFAFLPYRFMHYAHLELQMSFWMPLCLWALHRAIESGRVRTGLLAGLFLALQTLSSWYYGIFFATFLAPAVAAFLIGAGPTRARRALRPLAAGAALAVLLVAPFARPYFAVRQYVGERPVAEIEFYSARPSDYLAAHPRNALLGTATAGWGGQERELFAGIAVPLIALIGLWPPLSAMRIGLALGLVLAFELSLGFNGLLYPWLHAYVLPYRGLRVPARMAMVVGFALAILSGYGAARLARWAPTPRARSMAVLFLVLLVYAESRSTLTLTYIWPTPPPVYTALPLTHPVIVNLPFIAPDVALEPSYMYFSTFDWPRLVNGYSGFSPPSYTRLYEAMRRFPDDASIDELRRRQVEFVVVHGAFYRFGDYLEIVARLEARPELRLKRVSQWLGREDRLYELLPASLPR